MPQTPNRGYEFEVPGEDFPGRTLTGGPSGTSLILAEQVDTDVNDIIANLIGGLADRVLALEAIAAATRWRHITSGSGGAGNKMLIVPAGFERLRLTVTGDFVSEGRVQLQVNDDATSNSHVQGRIAWDTVNPPNVQDVLWATDNAWDIVQWSSVESNNVIVDIFPTDGRANPSFVARGARIGTSAEGHTIDFTTGKYLGDVVVSSLELIDPAPNEFSAVSWWLEGYIAP